MQLLNMELSTKELQIRLEKARSIENNEEILWLMLCSGLQHIKEDNYKESLSYFLGAYSFLDTIQDKYAIVWCNGCLGRVCRILGKYVTAHLYLEEAVKVVEELPDKFTQILWLSEMAQWYYECYNSDLGLKYFQKAQDLFSDETKIEHKGQILYGLCQISFRRGDLDKARKYAQQIEELSNEQLSSRLTMLAQISYAKIDWEYYLESTNRSYLEQAYKCSLEAVKLYEKQINWQEEGRIIYYYFYLIQKSRGEVPSILRGILQKAYESVMFIAKQLNSKDEDKYVYSNQLNKEIVKTYNKSL